MSATTSVPAPVFGARGFIAPAESSVLAGVSADINAAFGGKLNFTTKAGAKTNPTPQAQLAASETAIIGNSNAQFLYYCNQVDPAFASGRMQDAIARIYFISRNPALPTVVTALCTGLAKTIIPTGAIAKDISGNLYVCTGGGTIPIGGSISLQFSSMVNGPVPCLAGTLTTIYTAVFGWDLISNPADGVLGAVVEGRAAFEARRQQMVTLNSRGMLSSILAAVLDVPGVLDAYVTENDTGAPVTIRGVLIGANTLFVSVSGGAAQAVAEAIWSKKSPGCAYQGNTTLTVLDTNSGYSPPYPAYSVTFQTAVETAVYFAVTIAAGPGIPSNADVLVQAAVIAAFAGTDGGLRARIGSTIYASRFYGSIAALGSWAQVVSVLIGTDPLALGNSVTMTIGEAPVTAPGDITLAIV